MDGMIPMGGMDCWLWNTDILVHLGNQLEQLSKCSLLAYPMLLVVQDLKILAAHVLLDISTKSASVHPADVEAPVSSSSGFILTRDFELLDGLSGGFSWHILLL